MKAKEPSIGTLSADNTHVVVSVGDEQVDSAVVYTHGPNGMHFIRKQAAGIPDAARGREPGIGQLSTALWSACDGLGNLREVEYRNVHLVLPAWCLSTSRVSASMVIPGEAGLGLESGYEITPRHVRDLLFQAAHQELNADQVVVDLQPLTYLLDSGESVTDPVRRCSRLLRVELYRVTARRCIVESLMQDMRALRLDVDSLQSPYNAARGLLSDMELAEGAAVIDVGRQSTECSFFVEGRLVRAYSDGTGSADVLAEVARELDVDRSTVLRQVERRRDVLPSIRWGGEWSGRQALSDQEAGCLELLDGAAEGSVRAILDRFAREWDEVNREWDTKVRHVVLVGDEGLSVRNLYRCMRETLNVRCEWRIPTEHLCASGEATVCGGGIRTIGAIRAEDGAALALQPFLTEFRMDRMAGLREAVRDGALDAWQWWRMRGRTSRRRRYESLLERRRLRHESVARRRRRSLRRVPVGGEVAAAPRLRVNSCMLL